MLKPLIIINVLLSIGRIFYADFGLFYQVPRNVPQLFPTTDVIDTYVYRTLTALGDVGMASAAGAFQAIVGFVLVLGSNWLVRRTQPDPDCLWRDHHGDGYWHLRRGAGYGSAGLFALAQGLFLA